MRTPMKARMAMYRELSEPNYCSERCGAACTSPRAHSPARGGALMTGRIIATIPCDARENVQVPHSAAEPAREKAAWADHVRHTNAEARPHVEHARKCDHDTPEIRLRALWSSVLLLALSDFVKADEHHRVHDERWMRSRDFNACCFFAGLYPVAVRERIHRNLDRLKTLLQAKDVSHARLRPERRARDRRMDVT
jgi:hypothetical protein